MNQKQQQLHLSFMKMALKLVYLFQKGVPVGCVMVQQISQQQYQPIAKSHNLTNASKNVEHFYKPTLHCQIICIKQLQKKNKFNLNDVIAYVTCQPCIMCAQALNIVKIKKVYFGCKNEKFGGNGSVLKIGNYEFEMGMFQKECIQILKKFYQRGNIQLPQQKRHRKKRKIEQQKK